NRSLHNLHEVHKNDRFLPKIVCVYDLEKNYLLSLFSLIANSFLIILPKPAEVAKCDKLLDVEW
ncbi:MAG: hypothetical protein QF503_01885, partial [Rhodospirillales bacterium]|nr:hypothetical protein [Rhodospirillales bacterium]